MRKIKDMLRIERPREKLIEYGTDSLNLSELIAILLRTGTKKNSLLQISKKVQNILLTNPNPTIDDLTKIDGVGKVKAIEILSCIEIGKRLLLKKETEVILTPKDVWENMSDIRSSNKENFIVFFLDVRNQVLKREIISIGTLNESLVHPREVFQPAILNSASNIILAHNHPSGDTEPSLADIMITKELIKAGKILGIEIKDHIIVTKNDWASLSELGEM